MTGVLLLKCAFENKVSAADMAPDLNNIYSSLFIWQKTENVSVVKLILLYYDILHSVHYNSINTLVLWNPE
jgi:hypothetical protein